MPLKIFDAHDLHRTLLPGDQESEAQRLIRRERSAGALLSQLSKPDQLKSAV